MSTNYYALILEGKEPEILESWDECKAKMSGTSRPVYRKFSTEDEAKKFIAGEWRRPVSEKARKWLEEYKAKDVQLKEETQFDTSALSSRLGDLSKEGKLPCVYVDGSYNPESETYGFGVVFICDGKIEMFYGGGREKDLAETRNITGELLAWRRSNMLKRNRNVKSLLLFMTVMIFNGLIMDAQNRTPGWARQPASICTISSI